MLVTKRDYPARNVAEFITPVKARPVFTYSMLGFCTIGHLAGVLSELREGLKIE